MANFDMRGQSVTNQYNAGRDINFGNAQNTTDVIAELEKLKKLFTEAKDKGILNEDVATDAEYQVTKAVQQAKKPEPDKRAILSHLNNAKNFVQGLANAGGVVITLVNAIQAVQKLF